MIFGESLVRIEEQVNHLATSAELKALRIDIGKELKMLHISIEKMKAQFNMVKWLLGIIALGVVGLFSRYFPFG